MAFATVNMVGPRAEQREQKEKKKDPMDYLLEGLQIAQGITGIAVNYQTIKSKMGENSVAEDSRAGVMPIKEKAAHLENFDSVAPGTEGSQLMKYRKGDQVEEVSWLPRKKAEPGLKIPTRMVETTGPDGKPVQRIIEDKVGAEVPAYVKPDKPSKPDEFGKVDIAKLAITEGNTLMRETRSYNEVIKSADDAGLLIEKAKTNPVATAPALRKLARASGEVGVLTDADVEAFGGSQAIFARLQRAAETASTGTLTPEDAAFAQEIAQMMKGNAIANRDSQVNEAVDRFSENTGLSREEAHLKLTGKKPGAATQQKQTAYRPGTVLEINGKQYKVEQDGDTLTEIPSGKK